MQLDAQILEVIIRALHKFDGCVAKSFFKILLSAVLEKSSPFLLVEIFLGFSSIRKNSQFFLCVSTNTDINKLNWRVNHIFLVITNRDFYCMLFMKSFVKRTKSDYATISGSVNGIR